LSSWLKHWQGSLIIFVRKEILKISLVHGINFLTDEEKYMIEKIKTTSLYKTYEEINITEFLKEIRSPIM
jgi:hypothetical protein